MQQNYGYIYFTKNSINNKKYLGSGKDLIPDIKKYSKENFEVYFWEYCRNQEELDTQEKYYIKKYNAVKDKMYYNILPGPCGWSMTGKTHSEETKKKMSEAKQGNKNHRFGKSPTLKTRNKLSEALKGEKSYLYKKVLSIETKKKMSLSKVGKNHPNFGKQLSEETKQKQSKAKLGIKQKIVKCPHCEKSGGKCLMSRYHFDNCKNK